METAEERVETEEVRMERSEEDAQEAKKGS
jgi:hypothetical protein